MKSNIKEYKLHGSEWSSYIPILDEDPVFAARFLTVKDLKKAHVLLKKVFDEIAVEEPKHEPLYDTIMDSSDNFMWFVVFFKEIEEALGIFKRRYKIPYSKAPKNSGEAPNVYNPYTYDYYATGMTLKYERSNVRDQIPVNNYRILYIKAGYDMSEFQGGCYPGWYLLKNTVVFEEYNEKTNTRVKIEFRDGEFQYFIAGASDNWKQIADVPLEMDHIVSALIFRNPKYEDRISS